MNIKSVVLPLIGLGTTIVGVVLLNNPETKNALKVVSSVAKTAAEVTKKPESTFGGVPQHKIDELVENTYRGIKAVISGDTLEYWYKSSSGRMKNMARLIIDEAGELKAYLGSGSYFYANSPRSFTEKLKELMNNI